MSATPQLLAISDLHVGHVENRPIVEGLRPQHPGDWLIVGGDVAERGPEAGHGRPEVQGEQEQHERVAGHRSPSAVR
ncbi:metallophosphoesterase [Kibdelosporangium lantanae]|uniref:Metallophosphoesterase n=1 Tax=Kibdelosporangium lantanae TaxID=1497396 RepID=A0ABW3MHA7_9PSEU